MKLYLSSVDIPNPQLLSDLLAKPLNNVRVALIPNAKDYYSEKAWNFTINSRLKYMKGLGLNTDVIDLKNYTDPNDLKNTLSRYDLIWAMGGNAFMLRYEMQRSGFDTVIHELLDNGKVYGGDSAGAMVVGLSINGIESMYDEPEFAEQVINRGIGLIPFSILPHVDDAESAEIVCLFKELHKDEEIIELTDLQAFIFDNGAYRVITSQTKT